MSSQPRHLRLEAAGFRGGAEGLLRADKPAHNGLADMEASHQERVLLHILTSFGGTPTQVK
jgi:hypothetical protein